MPLANEQATVARSFHVRRLFPSSTSPTATQPRNIFTNERLYSATNIFAEMLRCR